ncbi:glycogen/starch/alpha-glucan phosphorylase [Methylotenera sp.]|uniref:glycogen/starch/alpha-glucan phosphorylase n=1 Tax=Methylotenera sp. TaxID=2051956 RepID=UPI0027343944|nr:glycogen/starch/alpha-glucan phosphorylase [Methylotenera sp.]MDP3306986.1 glycogen/starch/alpha-glucan phosphorylase [Methylotenera sp.]
MSDVAERALHTRVGRSVDALRRSLIDNLFYITGRSLQKATPNDLYIALAYTVRDRMLEGFITTAETYKSSSARTVCYFSAEYLLGPHLGNNILNLGLWDNLTQAMLDMGVDMETILQEEPEPGLGNGGLGRLAACYMDSLATLQIPAIGYGIRYEFGLFQQVIKNGWQEEVTDAWLRNGNPWELPNRERRYLVKLGGHTDQYQSENGHLRARWVPDYTVYGVAYDTPILGYGVLNTNLLRLWKSEAYNAFNFQAFNMGNHCAAVEEKVVAENLSKVLYPNDASEVGKELRLKQQYFFVSCSLQDMVRIVQHDLGDLALFPEKFVAQLNDTHPAIAIPELMRLLIDEHAFTWEVAWDITRSSFAYTNHTLLPEALETWSLDLFKRILPRHLEIIYEINQRFLDEVRLRFLYDDQRISRMSLISDETNPRLRMAHLAAVGSFAINGVSAIHTSLLKTTVMQDFYELWPEKFCNKTNGVTPRRFIALANRPLTKLIDDAVGGDWLKNMALLKHLEPLASDISFQSRWREVKLTAKHQLSNHISQVTGITVDPTSMFDIQAKRFHEYKRQHLSLLHIISLYHRLKCNPNLCIAPRTFIFSGKAAPGYGMAKLIIKLIHSVAETINHDPQVNQTIKVVFLPNFNVKNAQHLYPAADLSEQISTAGKEASGTGNMKFSMNGALTIGTLDGANVEIREAVGEENFFLFGLTAAQVQERLIGGYQPRLVIESDTELENALNMISSGLFSHGDRQLFAPLVNNLREQDPYLVCADYRAYLDCQDNVGKQYLNSERWTHMSILNVARIGRFSSDRAIQEYADEIWKVVPVFAKP